VILLSWLASALRNQSSPPDSPSAPWKGSPIGLMKIGPPGIGATAFWPCTTISALASGAGASAGAGAGTGGAATTAADDSSSADRLPTKRILIPL